MITLIRGAQRYLSFTAGTNGYAQCSQIVVKLVNVNSGAVAKEWRKVLPSPLQENTNLGEVEATPGDDNKKFRVWLTAAESRAMDGKYNLYVERTIAGEKMPIDITKVESYLEVLK